MLLKRFPGRASWVLPCIALAVSATLSSTQAFGDPAPADMNEMKRQIRGLQEKIERLENQVTQSAATPATNPAPAAARQSGTYEGIQAGPLNIRFGGFIELAGLYRSRDEVTDVGSSFSGIPYASSPAGNLSEFRASARQSRLSLLISGPSDDGRHAEAYYEMDFLGGAQTAIKAAGDRQAQVKTMTQTMLDSIEGVSQEETATKILALQTSLSASYQTTAMLYQLSLAKFL